MSNKKVDNRRVREIYHINRLSSPLPYQGEGGQGEGVFIVNAQHN